MKVTSKRTQDLLKKLGWTEVEETTCNQYVKTIRDGDPESYGYLHDWYYGPIVIHKKTPALRLRRPKHISRSIERKVFKRLVIVSALEKANYIETSEHLFDAIENIVEQYKCPLFRANW